MITQKRHLFQLRTVTFRCIYRVHGGNDYHAASHIDKSVHSLLISEYCIDQSAFSTVESSKQAYNNGPFRQLSTGIIKQLFL